MILSWGLVEGSFVDKNANRGDFVLAVLGLYLCSG